MIVALCLSLLGVQEPVRAIPLRAAEDAFYEARALSDAEGGKLWGKRLYGPMLFVDLLTRTVVANEIDADGTLNKEGAVFTGKLPLSVPTANAAIPWSGTLWTMVIWPLPSDPSARGSLMMHECYHRIQRELRLINNETPATHLDDAKGRTWFRLEMRALAAAVSREGEERRIATLDALAFRAHRRALCGEAAAQSEAVLELNEGLAQYTGLMTGVADPGLRVLKAAKRLLEEQESDTMARSFAYATGPAYGMLLDEQVPGWREQLSAQSDLAQLLAGSLKVGLRGPAADPRRLERYSGKLVLAQEAERADRRARVLAGFQQAFVAGPTVTLTAAEAFSFNFNPNKVQSWPDHGQVFETSEVSDSWGLLKVIGAPGMLMERTGNRISRIILSASSDTGPGNLSGPGWTLSLKSGWELRRGARPGDWVVFPSIRR